MRFASLSFLTLALVACGTDDPSKTDEVEYDQSLTARVLDNAGTGTAISGDQAEFLTISLKKGDVNVNAIIDSTVFSVQIDGDLDGVFRLGSDAGVNARDILHSCMMMDPDSGIILMGPADIGSNPFLQFIDCLPLEGDEAVITLRCEVSDLPAGTEVAIGFVLQEVKAFSENELGSLDAPVTIESSNGPTEAPAYVMTITNW